MTSVETFIPDNQLKSYMMVDFVELQKETEDSPYHTVIVVNYRGEEYKLLWDERKDGYVGIVNNEKGYIP